MLEHSEAWPHGEVKEAFPEVFYVVGTNRTHHAGIDLQTSRTMTVLRQNRDLTLVNTVRLTENPPLSWTPQLARECARSDPWSNRSKDGSGELSHRSSRSRQCGSAESATVLSDRSQTTWT
jgi:hypothetical protein